MNIDKCFIYNKDVSELFKEIDDETINLIVTDPPYKCIKGGRPKRKNCPSGILKKNDGKIFKNNDIRPEEFIPELYRILKNDSQCYIMVNLLNLNNYINICLKCGFRLHNLLIWEKNNVTPSRWYMKNAEYILFLRKGKAKPINNISSKTVHHMFYYSSGISITDTYWIKEENDEILWKDINYHDNGFEPIFATYYLDGKIKKTNKIISPDFTTDGIMEKFWFMSGDKPFLAKMDNKYDNTLSANEIIYFKTAAIAGIDTTPYLLGETKNNKYCACPCFINNADEDYISAMQIRHTNFSLSGEMLIRFFIEKLGYEEEMKQMITLDCLFHNKDRHEKNFGIKKTKNGFKFIAPFDNGFCLGADRI